MTLDLAYVALLLVLFLVPRFLQRYRIPSAITSLALGAVSGLALGQFRGDATIQLLSTFGIVALFLFAGLEVDVPSLHKARRILTQHLVLRLASLGLVAAALGFALGTGWQESTIIGLALITPSTGFILDSLHAFHLNDHQTFWVKSKAIASEIVALGILFVTVQSGDWSELTMASLALLALVLTLPIVFRLFAYYIIPHAPRSEFAFLLIVAVLAAVITKKLGAYYLVGAFLVGIVARRCRDFLPAAVSERTTHAVELFAAFFVPFYFFHAGLELQAADLTWWSLLAGVTFVVVLVPFRLGGMVLHRRLALGEAPKVALRTALALQPTLVFTLVLADILRERFHAPTYVFGGLVLYAVATTLLPGFLLHVPPPDFETPLLDEEALVEPPAESAPPPA